MTSFNHYALGAVADWMHRTLGGLTRTEPGWTRFTVRPPLWSGLDRASVRLDAPTGPIRAAWEIEGGKLSVDVQVPPGAVADLELPGRSQTLGPGRHRVSAPVPPPPRTPSRPTAREAIDDSSLCPTSSTGSAGTGPTGHRRTPRPPRGPTWTVPCPTSPAASDSRSRRGKRTSCGRSWKNLSADLHD
ncbi:alpha-L-rhamnosidase C-terminal domain-containing protein [Streptomyces pilosus]|uniref:alpha-L-rhamnosidase C-terminal domain-containing protein n=1 Tax=Streptomyces pilosus TaxID=28893 RepID=UPI003570F1DD